MTNSKPQTSNPQQKTACLDPILALEAFRQLPQAKLESMCDRIQVLELPEGSVVMEEGEPFRGFFILVRGRVSITRLREGVEMPIGQHEAVAFFGEIAVLMEAVAPVTYRTISESLLYQIPCSDFLELLHEYRDFERSIFRVVGKRLRGLESFICTRQKMAALGTLAAGLAHELNNPAAAVVRALRDVVPAIKELEGLNLSSGQANRGPEPMEAWQQARERGYEAIWQQSVDLVTLSDREDELLEWLEDYGVQEPWKLTDPLALGGIDPATLEQLNQPWQGDPPEVRDRGIRWLALSLDVMLMIKNGLRGAERISGLVGAMKSYTYLDRGVRQYVDVHDGIEDTLLLFSYKLKYGMEVKRYYDRSLPQIHAYGSELNQVWTNLIDNAIDAMNGEGTLEILTCRDGKYVHVEIVDSGKGIPPEMQLRIFEPFFTTKEMGKGSGLGLDTVQRIVQNRHHGVITVDSRPGRTCFTVCLPIPADKAPRSS